MKLTTKVTVQKIRVIADYQRKDPNPMFVAILKAAFEHNFITISDAREKLSGPTLNPRMWENILDRLCKQGYFTKESGLYVEDVFDNNNDNEFYYELTDFGREAAKRDTFFKSMKGELDIWIVKDKIDWLPFQIVKIEEIKGSRNEVKNSQKTEEFDLPKEQVLDLKNVSFRLEKIENKCEFLNEKDIELRIDSNDKYSIASIEDLEFQLESDRGENLKEDFRKFFLGKEFNESYNDATDAVQIPFDDNIQFKRDVKIKKPTIGEVIFNPITLNDIHFMAKTIADAEKWRLAWMQANIKDYIFKDEDFEKLAYKIWNEFKPHYSISRLSISDYEKHLEQDKKENFYELMRLQAPKLLTF